MDEPSKVDEQLNDRVDSSFFCRIHKRLYGLILRYSNANVKALNFSERMRSDVALVLITLILRTVPTIVTAHTFCASRDTKVSYGWFLLIQEYFCAVKTVRKKQNLPNALGISKENWG